MTVPVTLADARRQLRLEADDTTQDVEIGQFIADAVGWVEAYTGHLMVARDVTRMFDGFGAIAFREWPVASGAVATVTYADATGYAVPVTAVRVAIDRRPVRVIPWAGTSWPAVKADAVTVTVRAGYEDGAVVPAPFRRAILMLVAAYDADREGGEMFAKAEATARQLLGAFRPRAL